MSTIRSLMKRQLAFLLACAQVPIEWLQPPSENADGDADITFQDELPEDLLECLSNSKLSVHFKEFGKEVGVADAKSLEDVYKSHLENTSEWRFDTIDLILTVSRSRSDRKCGFRTCKSCRDFRQCFRQCWVRE
jgi:RPN1 N-terminal domain